MCGEIGYENISKKIGSEAHTVTSSYKRNDMVMAVSRDATIHQALWLGHTRSETPISPEGAELVILPIKNYTEKGVWFNVPEGKAIEAFLVKNPNFKLAGGQGIFIVTRPATSEELKKCSHPRHPKFINKKDFLK